MKRFYKNAICTLVNGSFEIHLDGKPARMPSGRPLVVAIRALGDEIAGEWQSQGNKIVPDTMPVTQIVITAQERVSENRQNLERETLGYLNTDMICYRAPDDEPVAAAQKESWDRWLEWFAAQYGVQLECTTSLSALSQPVAAHKAVEAIVRKLDDLRFTVLNLVTGMSGSIVLALAFMDQKITPQELQDASRVEDIFKAKIYREDIHGLAPNEEKRIASVARDLAACRRIIDILYLEELSGPV